MNRMQWLSLTGALALSTRVLAADAGAAALVQQDATQQQAIEQGLQSGELTAHEAGQLEHREARIDHVEAHAMANGSVSTHEQQHIDSLETRADSALNTDLQNAATANPSSAQSARLESDVARNVSQQQEILQHETSAPLTDRQVGKLERGQARLLNREADDMKTGEITDRAQRHIDQAAAHQSLRIARR